jgi:hypothetical protein
MTSGPPGNIHHLLVSAGVAVLCGGILVLFTDIEVSVEQWVNCGPFSLQNEKDTPICR